MKKATTNRPTNHGRQGSTGGNSVYVAIAGEVVNRRYRLLRNFVLNGKESASNPLLHIPATVMHKVKGYNENGQYIDYYTTYDNSTSIWSWSWVLDKTQYREEKRIDE